MHWILRSYAPRWQREWRVFNLCFHVLFESQYAAQMFENNLALGTRTLHSPLNKHEVETRISRANGMPNDLKRIFHLDYDSNDSESFQSTSSSESLTTVAYFLEPSTKEFQFQRIEHEKIFPSCVKAECLYLVSKKECSDHEREFGKYDRDPNNRLALSRDMYGWYDGVSVDVPIVNMLPGNVEEHPSIGSRRKVDVFVKVVDVRYADLVFSRLRDGSTTTTDPLMMKTFVHVENPDTFCFCMMWKYNDNAKRVIDFFDTNRAMIEWKNKSRNIYC
ncbi:hypothetical protein CCR75_000777 [Bremia lactucae]|uniref:Uncharacterized protein n=1 Tax=Bremia lactucae TaxID=4779 RepID=A0A976IHZ2_BRELC|nr:hypothetical protein CCR75_000777 [Bremia lactucae]